MSGLFLGLGLPLIALTMVTVGFTLLFWKTKICCFQKGPFRPDQFFTTTIGGSSSSQERQSSDVCRPDTSGGCESDNKPPGAGRILTQKITTTTVTVTRTHVDDGQGHTHQPGHHHGVLCRPVRQDPRLAAPSAVPVPGAVCVPLNPTDTVISDADCAFLDPPGDSEPMHKVPPPSYEESQRMVTSGIDESIK